MLFKDKISSVCEHKKWSAFRNDDILLEFGLQAVFHMFNLPRIKDLSFFFLIVLFDIS